MRLLVLDDDAATGRLVSRIATAAGFVAAATTTEDEFATECQAAMPDVVVLDLQLGDTDGIAQLRGLAHRRFSGSIILVSGFDSRVLTTAGDLAGSLGLSVAAALPKPIDVSELRQVLRGIRERAEPLCVQRLLQAIAADEMRLEYQPIVTRRPRSLCRLEALIRWQHPTQGYLGPDRFVPMAEGDADAINALTDWVIAAAMRDHQYLQAAGVTVPIAVNISARSLHDLGFPDRVERLLKHSSMPPELLWFEITETAAFHDAIATVDILSRIRLKGIQFAVGNFGSGYSSLKLLRQMPFNALKIDRSFVADLATSCDARAIVRCIVDLADNLELESVAEGVETESVADMLEDIGVDCLQGFLIARPMPVSQIPVWLEQSRGRVVVERRSRAESPAASQESGLDNAGAERTAAFRVARAARDYAAVWSQAATDRPHLSPRQLAVMRLLAEGCSVKAMARRLDLSVGTVKTHLSQAYAVLGAHNRVEALRRSGMMFASAELERRSVS